MKKILFKSASVLLAMILLITQTQSLSAKPLYTGFSEIAESAFTYNQQSLDAAMHELNELASYLDQNEGLTYNDLASAGSELIMNVSSNASPLGLNDNGDDLLGIPPFLWGCVLGWVGLLLVYILTDNDKPSVKKAFTGCLVSTGVSVALYVVYAVWILNEVDNL